MTAVADAPVRAAKPRKGTRELIAEVLAQGVTKAKLRALLDTAMASEIRVEAECPACGETGIHARIPDVKKQLDVVAGLLEQAEGRPEQRAPGALTVTIVRPPLG